MRKHNIGKKILCGAMAACMCVAFVPAQAFASSSGRYVSALHMAYGSNGAQKLEDAGYTVVKDEDGNAANINQDTGEDNVYLGYETTTDATKALTDIAVMNMNAGYSLAAYKEKLEADKTSATAKAYEFQSIIKEFRTLYKSNPTYGAKVVALLNYYVEDDSGLGMGDFLLNEKKCTEDTLANVMLQSNEDNFLIVEQLLSKALATNFVSDIPNLKMDASYSSVTEADAQAVFDQCTYLRKKFKAYEKNDYQLDLSDGDSIEESLDTVAKADEDDEEDVTDAVDALEYGTMYDAFKSIQYGDSGDTLLDLVMTNPKNVENVNNYKPLTSLLSTGQFTLMGVVGLGTLVLDSINHDSFSKGETLQGLKDAADQQLEKVAEESTDEDTEAATTVSMYEGVNRELFTSDNVALTSDVIRNMNATGDTSFLWNNDMSKAFYVLGGIFAFAAGMVYLVHVFDLAEVGATAARIADVTIDCISHIEVFVGTNITPFQAECLANAQATANFSGVMCGVLVLISCALELWAIGKDIYSYYHPSYKEIPDVMVAELTEENEDGDLSTYYIDYKVVRDLDDRAGDANAWGGKSWNAIYTSTKKTAGDPITVDGLVVRINNNAAPTSDAVGVHNYSDLDTAYDLNSHVYEDVFSGGDKDEIYMFFERDENAYTASAFANGYMFLAAGVGLLVGIAGTLAVSSAARKRRKEAPAAA